MKKKKPAKKKIAKLMSPAAGTCECQKDPNGKWYRWTSGNGGTQRIPPAYDSQEECEANCS